jgi:GNAT superfamily N-acetyltransferase
MAPHANPAIRLRPLARNDEPFLWRMLELTANWDPARPYDDPRADERARRYVEGWGEVPELAVAVETGERGRGIGTMLLTRLVGEAGRRGLPGLSLHVDHGNPARRLYERLGFRCVRELDSGSVLLRDASAG